MSLGSPGGQTARAEVGALYERVAQALDRSAQLAEAHAQRLRNDPVRSAETELIRAKRAREAARRGRALASHYGPADIEGRRIPDEAPQKR